MREAPLFVDCRELWTWLTGRLLGSERGGELRPAVLLEARQLLDSVTLALTGFDPPRHAQRADELATLLRLHVRLLADCELLDDSQLIHVTERLDAIGRQLGGWRKRLDGLG